MKYLLLSILLLAGIAGLGQNSTVTITDTPLIQIQGFYGFPGERLPFVDTLKVFFLVSDTSRKYQISQGVSLKTNELISDTSWFEPNSLSFFVPGYIARRKKGDQYNESFWMENVAFLTDDKKPLSSHYVIWQTAPRK